MHGLQNLSLLAGRDKNEEIERLETDAKLAEAFAQPGEGEFSYVQEPKPEKAKEPGFVFEDRTPLSIDIGKDTLPGEVIESLNRVGFPKT